MFEELSSLYTADRDYYMSQAEAVGVDTELFADCYDSGRGVEQVLALDQIRLERGIYGQPTFDLNGMIALGAIPIEAFRDAIDQQLP
jgi:predicted DsbA family dithiol-disulfide isomerase